MSNENLAFIAGMQKFASELGVPLEGLLKQAGIFDSAGRLAGKFMSGAGKAPGKLTNMLGTGVLRARNAVEGAVGDFANSYKYHKGVQNPGVLMEGGASSAKPNTAALRNLMAKQRAGSLSQAELAQLNSVRSGLGAPSLGNVPTGQSKALIPYQAPAAAGAAPEAAQPAASGLRSIFDTAKGDLGSMAGNLRSGNWEAVKQQLRANPARWAGYGAGGLYAGGVGKDYMDLATDSDEFDYSPIGKLMMGLGIKDKPSVFTPLNPLHRNFSGFWG